MTTAHFNADELERVRSMSSLPELLTHLCADLLGEPALDGYEVNLCNLAQDALVTAAIRLPTEFSGIERTYQGFQYRLEDSDANACVYGSGIATLINLPDLGRFHETTRMRFERWKIRCMYVLPLTIRSLTESARVIGTVMVFSQTTVFSPAALRRFEHLAELYAPHLSLYWTCRQLVERDKAVEAMQSELQQFIADITLMNSLTAVDEVYASIAAEFINRFHFDMVNILLEEDGELAMVHTSFSEAFAHLTANWEPFRRATRYSLTVRDGQSALIFLNNQRFLVEDAAKILHLPMSDKDRAALTMMETPHTFIIAPIRLDGNAIGVLWLATLGDVIALPENDLALIDLLMSFISTAIRNARAHMTVGTQKREIESLNTELQHKLVLLDKLAQHDSLTGLHNFGAFEAELKSRTSEYLRTGSDALSIILFDIDHFKLFNDSFGHPAGNEALQEIAQRLNKAVRDMDFTARYGGEEFVALLPHCTLPDAIVIAERIRGGIADQPVTAGGQSHRITISGGVAQYRSGESREQFFGRADRALYAAKEDGRNRMTADGS